MELVCEVHVVPPLAVVTIVPREPTAQPFSAVGKETPLRP